MATSSFSFSSVNLSDVSDVHRNWSAFPEKLCVAWAWPDHSSLLLPFPNCLCFSLILHLRRHISSICRDAPCMFSEDRSVLCLVNNLSKGNAWRQKNTAWSHLRVELKKNRSHQTHRKKRSDLWFSEVGEWGVGGRWYKVTTFQL